MNTEGKINIEVYLDIVPGDLDIIPNDEKKKEIEIEK